MLQSCNAPLTYINYSAPLTYILIYSFQFIQSNINIEKYTNKARLEDRECYKENLSILPQALDGNKWKHIKYTKTLHQRGYTIKTLKGYKRTKRVKRKASFPYKILHIIHENQ